MICGDCLSPIIDNHCKCPPCQNCGEAKWSSDFFMAGEHFVSLCDDCQRPTEYDYEQEGWPTI